MKYLKMLGLLAVAAAALMAFAGSASATTITSPEGVPYTGPVIAATEGGHAVLENTSLGLKIECAGTSEGEVGAEHGNEEGAVHPTFSGCTNSWHVTTIAGGTLKAVSNGNGTADMFSSGATISTTRLGITCNYRTNNTTIGTLTDGTVTGTGMGTMHINGAIPIHSGSSGLCGTKDSHWKGAYTVTTPEPLHID